MIVWLITAFLLTLFVPSPLWAAPKDAEVADIVTDVITKGMQSGVGGAAVAVRVEGRTLFFNFGWANDATNHPVTSDSLFNLGSVSKVFDATLLSLLAKRGEVSLGDSVAMYIQELQEGGDVRGISLGQLVTFTSGFSVTHDNPPWWPAVHYTLPEFLRHLKAWKIDEKHRRGKDYIYSHAGFMLLHVALERMFGIPYTELLEQQLLRPLDLPSTTLPLMGEDSTGNIPPALKARAVQGYSGGGKPIGKPGDMQGYYHWPGTGQMFSSVRDMSRFLAAHLLELPLDPAVEQAMKLTHQEVAPIESTHGQAQAWEVHHRHLPIVDKNGGLNNTTSYIGLIPDKRLGIVILMNRGSLNGRDFGHAILLRLSRAESAAR
jgi:beta-lactamase class C